MNNDFEIISQSRAPSRIVLADYNKHTNEFVTVGPGYFVTWAFRYGARHLIPRKMNRTEYKENNMFSHMVLEGTASRSQKIFLSVHTSCVVYNVFDGKQLSYRKDLHERDITAMTFFNPLKYLITGALDGTIKIWDNKWHIQMVFVGHTGTIHALDIYPHGSAIISACADKTIRVWNLDTCDEVDRATLDGPIKNLQTTLDYDTFFTYHGQTVDMWKIQHLYHIHTSVGQRVVKIKQTSHPNFSTRSVVMSRDSSVRLVSPVSGDVITTLLLSPNRGLVDVAYAIEHEVMFCVLGSGDILKVRTDTNPCHVVKHWKCADPEKEACNYLFVYEYVVDIELKTDTWGAIKRGVTTKSLNVEEDDDDDDDNRKHKKKKNMNRTLLLGGRKDGYICVYDWETGNVDFKIDAHGSKGVMSMIANAKVDQLISAGKDNVIKVWRVYPFVQEALAPLMSFFCAHLPLHMTMIKTNLCVAFQDHATATYSVVMYNLRDRMFGTESDLEAYDPENRYDHEPGDDHGETITGLSACSRLKLYASSSLDGTIRIWNETNTLVRLLKMKSVPHSVGFCSAKGDLLVGIDNHLYKIPYYSYLPKSYMFRMVSMKFGKQPAEHPLPETQEITQKMTKNDLSRLKNSHSSFKYSTFTDILTPAEEEEINRERLIKEKAFNLLMIRESELEKIRNGDLMSKKKPKATAKTKKVAFTQYMKMFYDKPKPTIPKDDPYPEDAVKEAVKEPEEPPKDEYCPEKEPTGFFPPASEATRPKPPDNSPLKAAYHIAPNGFVPNSILIKLLWPQAAKEKMAKRKTEEWKLPSFSDAQLKAIAKAKQDRERAENMAKLMAQKSKAQLVEKSVKFKPEKTKSVSGVSEADVDETGVRIEKEVTVVKGEGEEELLEEEEEFEDRVMEMDWGDDDEDNIYKEKSKLSDKESTKTSLKNKFADIMAKPPTPQEEEEPLTKEETMISKEKTMESSKQTSDLSTKSTPREIKPTKPIKKLVSRPPPPPPQPKPKSPLPAVKKAPSEQREITRVKTPTPTPTTPTLPRARTPLPGFITQFKGVEWFEKYFPNCETTMPKPWSLENFVAALVKLIKTVDYSYKIAIVEALLMLHAQDEFADNLSHTVIKAMSSVLNHQKDYPTCMIEDQRNFIIVCIKGMQKLLTSPDKEFVTELLVQFLDGDKEVRAVVITILTSIGMQDQHKFLPKELDSWDIWNVEEDDRKSDLRKMCHQWLDRWMTTYKLHLEDTIDRMKKGQNIHGRMSRDQFKKTPSNKSILRRSVGVGTDTGITEDQETVTTLDDAKRGVTVTFDKPPDPALLDNANYIDAINYFCDMMFEKEMETMRAPGKRLPGSKENVVQAKNTVLVLPKIPQKPSLVRLGETHTSHCRPHRETNLHVDYRLPPQTARGYHPFPGQITGFVNSINLPMKPLMLNPFPCALDELDARFQEPILITLKSAQKYFIPSQSIVPQEAVPAAL
ncbi:WD repeat-containing protein 97-like [Ruditapes philippinarum]|uniref:WD repeat-containing protein 97-like n=1 Tax=Ruditapes philippinarum TaxID=129788 RepID=UPI00295B2BBD|nr:WD repeat-containing protein 97-like [Ruditapes philippinarum]